MAGASIPLVPEPVLEAVVGECSGPACFFANLLLQSQIRRDIKVMAAMPPTDIPTIAPVDRCILPLDVESAAPTPGLVRPVPPGRKPMGVVSGVSPNGLVAVPVGKLSTIDEPPAVF